jgi:hypothetical protein
MRLLTPLAALAALAALLPLGAAAYGRIRVAAAARRLGLDPPRRWAVGPRIALAAAAVVLLAVAAAQPVLSDQVIVRTRGDAAVMFVLDTSRSMAASLTPTSPTRLSRARQAAARLRAAIPEVPAGVATLTDRVLPDLLPVPDSAGFHAVVEHGVAIEDPPPVRRATVATAYGALGNIATGHYFAARVKRRVIVLLTDGETNPFDPEQLAHHLSTQAGYRFLAIRFWNQNEAVFDANGQREPSYHPDPTGRVLLAELAAALGGRSYEEGQSSAAASYLRQVVGHGPVRRMREVPGYQTLAPYVAGLAIGLLLVGFTPVELLRRCTLAVRRRTEDGGTSRELDEG